MKPRPDKARGRRWPLLLGGLFLLTLVGNVALLLVATNDPSFAVVPDYYQQALRWDQSMEQQRRNARLGWQVAVQVATCQHRGLSCLRARVTQRGGAVVRGARVKVAALHKARGSRVYRAELRPGPDGGHRGQLRLLRPGLWELRITVRRGGQLFTQKLEQDVHLGAAP